MSHGDLIAVLVEAYLEWPWPSRSVLVAFVVDDVDTLGWWRSA